MRCFRTKMILYEFQYLGMLIPWYADVRMALFLPQERMNLPRKVHVIDRRGLAFIAFIVSPSLKARTAPSHSVLLASLQPSKTESETFCPKL